RTVCTGLADDCVKCWAMGWGRRRSMNDRHHVSDEKLDEWLRSLPELEPSADFTQRVMAQVMAAEAKPSRPWPAPPPWQLALALTVVAVSAFPLAAASWPALVRLLGWAGRAIVEAAQTAADVVFLAAALAGMLLGHAGQALAALSAAARTVAHAVVAEAAPHIALISCIAMGLQAMLWEIGRAHV